MNKVLLLPDDVETVVWNDCLHKAGERRDHGIAAKMLGWKKDFGTKADRKKGMTCGNSFPGSVIQLTDMTRPRVSVGEAVGAENTSFSSKQLNQARPWQGWREAAVPGQMTV